MKNFKILASTLLFFFVAANMSFAAENINSANKASNANSGVQQMAPLNASQIGQSLQVIEQSVKSETIKSNKKANKKMANPTKNNVEKTVLFILAIFIPFLAVGLHTDWGKPFIWSLLWTFLGFYLLGVIHAFIVLMR